MTKYDKQWVGIIAFVFIVTAIVSFVWWPGWIMFAVMNVALSVFAAFFMHGDPRMHEADDQ